MADLLDELRSTEAMASGGDLFDEAGIAPPKQNPQLDTEALFQQELQANLKALNDSLSPAEKLAVGFQKGLRTVGRGVGLLEDEVPAVKQGTDMLAQDSGLAMAGDVAGMASATLPAMLPVSGAGLTATSGGRVLIPAAERLISRLALGAATGAGEGYAISRGEGRSGAEQARDAGIGASIGGAIEVLMPVLGRLGNQVFRKLGRTPKGALLAADGTPSPELLSALKESGMSFDNLTDDAIEFIAKQSDAADPASVARAARFKSQGIPATTGDITQGFSQQAKESRLVTMAGGESGEPLRQFRLNQSETLVDRINQLIDGLGVPSDTGESIKAALIGRKELLRSQKNALYKQAAESAPEIGNVPIFGDTIMGALPDKKTMRRLGRMEGSQINALQDLLVEFGMDTSDDAVKAFTKSGGEVTPLTLGNLEDFRSALNMILRADKTGAASVAAGPVLDALDNEADEVVKALSNAGIDAGEDLLKTLGAARETTRQLKTEFNPKSIIGRLVDTKKGSDIPIIEASRVVRTLKAEPVESLERTVKSLISSGEDGRKAIGNMRAAVVLDALEDSLKAPSRKVAGTETIGGNQFAKSLQKFGDDRLEILFKGDKNALASLRGLQQTAKDITPAADAMPKGSAPVILDMLKKMGRLPGIAPVTDLATWVVGAGADDRAVSRALKAKPAMKKLAQQINRDYPALASALGIAGMVGGEEEE